MAKGYVQVVDMLSVFDFRFIRRVIGTNELDIVGGEDSRDV